MLVRKYSSARMLNTSWFPTIAELEAHDEERRREERIDEHMSEFLAQLHLTAQLPLAELARPVDPKSVMVELD